jgi:hypothetical protein
LLRLIYTFPTCHFLLPDNPSGNPLQLYRRRRGQAHLPHSPARPGFKAGDLPVGGNRALSTQTLLVPTIRYNTIAAANGCGVVDLLPLKILSGASYGGPLSYNPNIWSACFFAQQFFLERWPPTRTPILCRLPGGTIH